MSRPILSTDNSRRLKETAWTAEADKEVINEPALRSASEQQSEKRRLCVTGRLNSRTLSPAAAAIEKVNAGHLKEMFCVWPGELHKKAKSISLDNVDVAKRETKRCGNLEPWSRKYAAPVPRGKMAAMCLWKLSKGN